MCLACLVPTVTGLAIVLMHRATIAANPIPDVPVRHLRIDRPVRHHRRRAGHRLCRRPAARVSRWRAGCGSPARPCSSVLVVLIWSNISGLRARQQQPVRPVDSSSLFARVLHMASPYTAFASGDGDGEHVSRVMTSFTGSPGWYAVWTLALCGLAAMRRAVARRRRARCAAGSVGRSSCWSRSPLVALVLAVVKATRRTSRTTRARTRAVALASQSGG